MIVMAEKQKRDKNSTMQKSVSFMSFLKLNH